MVRRFLLEVNSYETFRKCLLLKQILKTGSIVINGRSLTTQQDDGYWADKCQNIPLRLERSVMERYIPT